MATIINNPGSTSDRIVEREDSSGWAVAVIVLVAVIAGGLFFYSRIHRVGATPASGGTNINLTVPTPAPSGGGASGGGAGAPSTQY